MNNHIENYTDKRKDELLTILSCIYSSGCRIEDYNKVLLYLQSFIPKTDNSKDSIIKNWVSPYLESMIYFFCQLKKDSEIMNSNREYIKG